MARSRRFVLRGPRPEPAGNCHCYGDHDRDDVHFYPGNLIVSRSVYDNNADNVTVGQILPPDCKTTKAGCPKGSGATNNGSYPMVFNNDVYDSSFGVTSKIYLDQISLLGFRINSIEVPNSDERLNANAEDAATIAAAITKPMAA